MGVNYNPSVTVGGTTVYLDAGNSKSYTGSGTTWTDISGNGNNGTLVNGPTFTTNNGGAIVFDGTNDHLTVGSTLPSGTNIFTISFWIYFSANISGNYGASYYGAVLASGNSVGTLEFVALTVGLTPGPPYYLNFGKYGGGTTGSCTASNVNMPILTWHNVVLVRDGAASQKMYLNGSQLVTGNVSDSFTSGTLYVAGAPGSPTFSGYLQGNISNYMVHSTALTADQVLQNYNALRGRFGV